MFEQEVVRVMEEEDNDDDEDDDQLPNGASDADRLLHHGPSTTTTPFDGLHDVSNLMGSVVAAASSSSSRSSYCPRHHRPKQYHLDMLMEYIDLLEMEGIDHDVLDCYELAYDLSVFLGRQDYLSRFDIVHKCSRLYEASRGPNHRSTKRFRAKLQTNRRSAPTNDRWTL
jgi:hypothetical protein